MTKYNNCPHRSLGNSASSGNSEGQHLHFGIRKGNNSYFFFNTPVDNNRGVINYIDSYKRIENSG